jgi:hypothetical protein
MGTENIDWKNAGIGAAKVVLGVATVAAGVTGGPAGATGVQQLGGGPGSSAGWSGCGQRRSFAQPQHKRHRRLLLRSPQSRRSRLRRLWCQRR